MDGVWGEREVLICVVVYILFFEVFFLKNKLSKNKYSIIIIKY